MATTYIDLVLDSGDLVRIECQSKHEDELHDALSNAQKRRDNWSPAMFDGCRAEFLGIALNRVNMARVVGML